MNSLYNFIKGKLHPPFEYCYLVEKRRFEYNFLGG